MPPAPDRDAAASVGRLRWRCRRGMKELDVLLERLFAALERAPDPVAWRDFERLLEADDPTLYRWLTGVAQPPDPRTRALVRVMRTDAPSSSP